MKTILFFAFFLFAVHVRAFRLSPIVANFTPQGEGATQSFFVENSNDRDVAIQIDIYYRTQNAMGEEVRTETDHFTVYPSQLVLKPQQKRTIRVTWNGPKELAKESAFRLVAEELPIDLQKKKKEQRSNIKFLLKYVASLYVVPEGAKPRVSVRKVEQVREKGAPHMALTLGNDGTAHRVLSEIRLKAEAKGKSFEIPSESLKVFETENLLAGGQKKFIFPWPNGLSEKDVKIDIDFKDSLGKNAK